MKINYKLILIALLSFFNLTACFEDKGNYDYKDMRSLVIEFSEVDTFVSLGEEMCVTTIIKDNKGRDIDESNYTFTWSIKGETREDWNKPNFKWKTDEIIDPQDVIILTVKDKRSGICYYKYNTCKVGSAFDMSGFRVLSEVNNKTVLSYIGLKFDTKTNPNYTLIESAKVFNNLYETINKESLGTGPYAMHEHFCRDSKTRGQVLLLQNSGIVDIDGVSYKKTMTGDNIFGGTVPSGVDFVNAAFMTFVDLLQDSDGKIYSRIRSTNKLFHSNFFLKAPMKYNGEELKNCELIPAPIYTPKYILVHDKKNNRLLTILDGGDDYSNPMAGAARIIEVPALPVKQSDIPDGFVPLNDLSKYEIINIDYFKSNNSYGLNGYSIIFKEKSGRIYCQEFDLSNNNGVLVVGDCRFNEITGIIGTPNLFYTIQDTYKFRNTLVALGNKLYIYDNNNPSDPLYPYITFKANVVSMNSDNYGSKYAGICLSDGSFHVINTDKAKNVPEEYRLLYSTPSNVNLGKILSTQYRVYQYYNW